MPGHVRIPIAALLLAALLFPTAARAQGATAVLPLIAVDTRKPIRDEPKVRARVRISSRAPGTAAADVYDGWAGIEIHGNTSQQWPKKSFGLELRTGAGKKRPAALLGLPADDDWVLYADYGDASLLRNVVGYDMARALGGWAPGTRFAELQLDGDWHGLYVLTERVELGPSRLDAGPRHPSGPYLVELQSLRKHKHEPQFLGPVSHVAFLYDEPKFKKLSPAQRRYVRRYVGRVERALMQHTEPWRPLLDERSTVDYVLLQELCRNVDGFRGSTFMVKPAGRPLRLGPAWDLDLAWGNWPRRGMPRTTGSLLAIRPWSRELLADRRFHRRLAARWHQVRAALLAAYDASIDAHAAELVAADAVTRELARWPRPWPTAPARRTWQDELAWMKAWLRDRAAWMDATLRR